MSKNLIKRILALIPLTPITTFFWVGKAAYVKELWICIATLFYGVLILIFSGAFNVHAMFWGVPLFIAFLITFVVGFIACAMSENRRDYSYEETVIDKVAGLILAVFLVIPVLVYAHKYFFGLIYHVCVGAFTCGSGFSHFVAFAVVTPIAFTCYFFFYTWDLWPRPYLERNFHNSFGTALDDLFLAVYVAFFMYLIFFLPFKVPFDQVYNYFAYSFSHVRAILLP